MERNESDDREPESLTEPSSEQSDERDAEPPTERLENTEERPLDDQAPPKLERSADRMLFGVAGGLGNYFRIDPTIIRIGFAVSIFFGGLGLLAYVGLAIFAPSQSGTEAVGSRLRAGRLPTGFAGLFLAILIGVSAIFAFFAIASGGFLAVALGKGVLLAVFIAVLGGTLIALAMQGRGRWLAVPLIALVAGGLLGAAVDLDLDGGIGEETASPQTLAAIPDQGYAQGIGRLAIDLRGLDWGESRRLDLRADLGIGELVLVADETTCIRGGAEVSAGEVRFAGERADGFDQSVSISPEPAGGRNDERAGAGRDEGPNRTAGPERTLVLDADVDLGAINVVGDDEIEIDSLEADDLEPEIARERNREACAG